MRRTPCYENEDGTSACPCSVEENETDSIVVEALKCRISWLQHFVTLYKKERDEAEKQVEVWRDNWEEERTKNVAQRDRIDEVVEKLYALFGEEP